MHSVYITRDRKQKKLTKLFEYQNSGLENILSEKWILSIKNSFIKAYMQEYPSSYKSRPYPDYEWQQFVLKILLFTSNIDEYFFTWWQYTLTTRQAQTRTQY